MTQKCDSYKGGAKYEDERQAHPARRRIKSAAQSVDPPVLAVNGESTTGNLPKSRNGMTFRPWDSVFGIRPVSPRDRILLHFQRPSEVVASGGVIRLQTDGFLELIDRLVNLALLEKSNPEIAASLGKIWFQANRFPELRNRLVEPSRAAEGDAEVDAGVGVIGQEAHGMLQFHDGVVGLVVFEEDDAEVVMGAAIE